MSTQAQITANQANAQKSTGPKTESGKAASSKNNMRFGLTGMFTLLSWENQGEFLELRDKLIEEYQVSTPTESILVDKMVKHFWLSQRAQILQEQAFSNDKPECEQTKDFALFMRYQTTHDRAFHKCLDQLLKLRAEKRKQEIGFESQKQEKECRVQARLHREAEQTRKQEAHEARVRLANAKAADLELDTEIRSVVEARLPGHVDIPFSTLKYVLKSSLEQVVNELTAKTAA